MPRAACTAMPVKARRELPGTSCPARASFDPENKFGVDRRGEGFSLRAGKVLSPSWDIQFGPSFASSSKGGNEIQRTTLDVAALYMFSRERFRPFALFGMGGEYDKVKSASPNVSGTSPFVTAGLGFQYAFNEKWGMQADVRRSHSYIRNDAFGFTRANSNLFTLGLIYVLGDTPARPAVARQEAPPPAPYVAPAPAAGTCCRCRSASPRARHAAHGKGDDLGFGIVRFRQRSAPRQASQAG